MARDRTRGVEGRDLEEVRRGRLELGDQRVVVLGVDALVDAEVLARLSREVAPARAFRAERGEERAESLAGDLPLFEPQRLLQDGVANVLQGIARLAVLEELLPGLGRDAGRVGFKRLGHAVHDRCVVLERTEEPGGMPLVGVVLLGPLQHVHDVGVLGAELGLLQTLPRVDEVVGGDRRAVAPHGFLAHVEGVGHAVRGDIPMRRAAGNGLQRLGIAVRDTLEDRVGDPALGLSRHDVRIEGLGLGSVDEAELGGLLGGGGEGNADQDESDE